MQNKPFSRSLVLVNAITAAMEVLSGLELKLALAKLPAYVSRGKGKGNISPNFNRPYPTN